MLCCQGGSATASQVGGDSELVGTHKLYESTCRTYALLQSLQRQISLSTASQGLEIKARVQQCCFRTGRH
jgi:hypothetical protein